MVWFWWWLTFVVLLLLIPLAYGWGYRGWGAPYPSYYTRANTGYGDPAVDPAGDPTVDPEVDPELEAEAREAAGWGLLADMLWVVLVVALVWLFVGLLL